MIKKYKKGFSLIEVLIAIAIIGVLATIAIASYNNARLNSRDAARAASLQGIYKQIMLLDTDGGASLVCSQNQSTTWLVASCSGIAGQDADFSSYIDPVAPAGTYCAGDLGITSPCQYSIGGFNSSGQPVSPATDNFEICTYIEKAVGQFSQGLIHLDKTGNLSAGCNLKGL